MFFTESLVLIDFSPVLLQSSFLLLNYRVQINYNQFIDPQLIGSLIHKSSELFSELLQLFDLIIKLFFLNHRLLAFDLHVKFAALDF